MDKWKSLTLPRVESRRPAHSQPPYRLRYRDSICISKQNAAFPCHIGKALGHGGRLSWPTFWNFHFFLQDKCQDYAQCNGAVSKVDSSGNCSNFSCATSSLLHMLTAGPRDQFPRWRRSRRRLSVCSVLRCPDLWSQCSVSFVHGLKKTHHTRIISGVYIRNYATIALLHYSSDLLLLVL
jgi:hypothetical protein